MAALYRIQDLEGRGPWRPGFSRLWVDPDGPPLPDPYFVELGWPLDEVGSHFTRGWHGGTACISKRQLRRWFTEKELGRLYRLGYSMVKFTPDRIIAETPTQVVFENRLLLAFLAYERARRTA